MRDWPRALLTESDLKAVRATRWRRFPEPTVIAIAEAWNAGAQTRSMARDLGCNPGSIRILIGRLSQRGVVMRQAEEAPFAAEPAQRIPPAVDRALVALQVARMDRLKGLGLNDPLLTRCLSDRKREQRRWRHA